MSAVVPDGAESVEDGTLSWDRFSIDVTREVDAIVVRLHGGLDFFCADQVKSRLLGIDEPLVIVDLTLLTFIDSTGLAALVAAQRAAREKGSTLSIRGAKGTVRRVFQIAEMSDALDD